MTLMQSDKKVEAAQVRFVLPEAIGRACLRADVPPDLVAGVLDALREDSPVGESL